jgi:hypothetical protein
VNEVFLALMFAGNTAVLIATAAKVRAWRKWIREYARECREAAHGAKGAYNAARAEANFCENTAGRCRQLEISAQHAAQRAERATGTDGAPPTTCAAPHPRPNPNGLRLYGADESDFRGTD